MRISTKTRYGSRALFELALAYPEGTVSVKEIARNQHLSTKYLESIIATLKAGNIIRSFRGVDGGYALTRPPDRIRMIDIFKILEGSPAIVDCVDYPEECEHFPICPTQKLWARITDAVTAILEETTLQDLLDQAPPFQEGLGKAGCEAELERHA